YYGAISAWFDVEAVRFAAERHPEWTFVLIGDSRGAALDSLDALANVHRMGEVAYSELPSHVAAFDVCTIPFDRTPLTEATDPVKLYEYRATGNPIVARRLPETEPFGEVVRLYETPAEFAGALEQAVADRESAAASRRRAIAQENSWDSRYRDLAAWIAA